MPQSRRLPKAVRLSEAATFIELLSGRRKAVGCLELASRKTALAGQTVPRLGIVAGRKNLPNAVGRNTLKRVIREAFRQVQHELPPRDMLFRLRARIAGVPRNEIKLQVREAVGSLLEHAKRGA